MTNPENANIRHYLNLAPSTVLDGVEFDFVITVCGNAHESCPVFPGKFEYSQVSIPIAVLIWLMIYPMMMKVDFESIRNVGKNPGGLFVTRVANWLIKPFTMYGIAILFFHVIFRNWITPDLARDYLAGAVLLGAASSSKFLSCCSW